MEQGGRGGPMRAAIAIATSSSTTGATQAVTPQESLMMDGTCGDLRHKIINQLKHKKELKKYTTSMVEQSQTLNTPGAEKKSKRDLFVSLKHKLEGPVLERASKEAWGLNLSKEGFEKEIMEMFIELIINCMEKRPPFILHQILIPLSQRSRMSRKRMVKELVTLVGSSMIQATFPYQLLELRSSDYCKLFSYEWPFMRADTFGSV
ncbi:hypothetical protein L7F22_003612 [Adiantum nelumboides]|nr:hypothetical protein [Adiantum nelumboides]